MEDLNRLSNPLDALEEVGGLCRMVFSNYQNDERFCLPYEHIMIYYDITVLCYYDIVVTFEYYNVGTRGQNGRPNSALG